MNDEKVQGIKEIEGLILKDQLKEAYDLCNRLLLNFPESVRVQRLQNKIEKIVFKKNLEIVKKDMDALKPLMKEGSYDAVLHKLTEFQRFVPGYAPVEKQIEKVQYLMQKNAYKKQKNTLNEYIAAAQKYMNEANYKEAITTLKRILLKLPDHQLSKTLLAEAKEKYITQLIKDNDFLLKSDKFDEIAEFIKSLKVLNPDSAQIPALIKKLSQKENMARKFEKMDFTYQSFEELETLYQKKKYEPCIKGLKELANVDKDNFKVLELLKSARKKFDKQLTKEIINKIKTLQKKFRKQKQEMPKEFIRL